MTNSPSGVQAGRDVVIQSDRKRLIESIVLRVSIETETPEAKAAPETWDFGLGSVVALFKTDKTRIRFVTDSKVYDQQISPKIRRLRFIYEPESPDQIHGQLFRTEKFAQNNESTTLRLNVELNGLIVGTLTATAPSGALANGQATFDVSNLFRELPNTYHAAISQTMTNSPGAIQASGNVTINRGIEQRRLTQEQEVEFMKILRDNPKGKIEISCVESGGPEPCNFARQLAGLMQSKEAGWTVNFAPLMFGAGDPTKTIPELYILAKKGNVPYRANVLQHALKSVGLNAEGIEREDVADNFVQLMVWFHRP